MRQQTLINTLMRNSWFKGLPTELMQQIVSLSTVRHFNDGQSIVRKGDLGDAMFGVITGSIKVTSTNSAGQEMIITFLHPGQWFGEISLIDSLPRTHDSRANGATDLLVFSREAFDSVMASHPALTQHLLKLLCQRLRTLMTAYDDSGLTSVNDRLGKRLAHLAKSFGKPHPDGTAIDIPLSQDNLAFMLGVTRQTIHKEIKVMEQQGLLRKAYGRVIVRAQLIAKYEGY